jgi:hypothetical protein
MRGLLEVGGGVPPWRGVAAADVTAGQAQPQVDPPGAGRQALLTAVRGGRRGLGPGRGKMRAAHPPMIYPLRADRTRGNGGYGSGRVGTPRGG